MISKLKGLKNKSQKSSEKKLVVKDEPILKTETLTEDYTIGIGEGNLDDTKNEGIYVVYTDTSGTPTTKYSGLLRDYTDGKFKFVNSDVPLDNYKLPLSGTYTTMADVVMGSLSASSLTVPVITASTGNFTKNQTINTSHAMVMMFINFPNCSVNV